MVELAEIYDNKRRPLNKTSERYSMNKGEYALVVHVWIMNKKGELLLQKRSENKKVYPGKWSVTGGGNELNETTLQTAIRECKEEIGIDLDVDKLELMLTVKREKVFVDVWLLKQDIDINSIIMQKDEVAEVRWVTLEEIRNMINGGKTSPSIEIYFNTLENLIKQ